MSDLFGGQDSKKHLRTGRQSSLQQLNNDLIRGNTRPTHFSRDSIKCMTVRSLNKKYIAQMLFVNSEISYVLIVTHRQFTCYNITTRPVQLTLKRGAYRQTRNRSQLNGWQAYRQTNITTSTVYTYTMLHTWVFQPRLKRYWNWWITAEYMIVMAVNQGVFYTSRG